MVAQEPEARIGVLRLTAVPPLACFYQHMKMTMRTREKLGSQRFQSSNVLDTLNVDRWKVQDGIWKLGVGVKAHPTVGNSDVRNHVPRRDFSLRNTDMESVVRQSALIPSPPRRGGWDPSPPSTPAAAQ